MKILSLRILPITLLLTLAVGCAADLKSKESTAVAAGFKVITPVKPSQVTLLASLPKDRVTLTAYQGGSYYVLPDVKNNRAYVGGPTEYQAYKQLRLQQRISEENLAAAQMNQMAASEEWNTWGGWGGFGGVPWGGMGYGNFGSPGGGHGGGHR
jgi:hypothetical protein